MVDYVYWATVDPLTVEQAARLWANVEPEMPTRVLASNDKKAVASRLQILKRAIIEGTLRAQSHTDDQASVGDHRSCLVQRVDLTAFALSRSEKPNFLFAPGAPSIALLSELEHLITDGSPLLQRAIEDALRRRRERTGNTNQGAVADVEPGTQPSGRIQRSRGAAMPRDGDDAVIGAMLLAASRTDGPLSVRDYVLAHEKEIKGGASDANIRRLQRKYSAAIKDRPA
jgi:hypothetical protein